MTLGLMTLSIMTLGIATTSIMTISIIMIGITTLTRHCTKYFLPVNVRLDWKVISRYKCSSLLVRNISDKEKKVLQP